MSGKIAGLVWDLNLPHAEAWVLLAMADHADHDGRNVYPSVGLVAWKTNYSARQVHRIIQSLRDKGILIPEGNGDRGTLRYRIDLGAAPTKTPYTSRESLPRKRDKMSQVKRDRMAQVTPDPDRQNGTPPVTPRSHTTCDSQMSYDPSLNRHLTTREEEETPPPPSDGSAPATAAAVNVNPSADPETIVILRAEGMVAIERYADLPPAVVRAAFTETNLPPGHVARPGFAAKRLDRYRAGDWSPRTTPTPSPAPAPPSEASPQSGDGVWPAVLAQLAAQIPPGEFTTYVETSTLLLLDPELAVVGAPHVFARDGLARYQELIIAALGDVTGAVRPIEFVIGADP